LELWIRTNGETVDALRLLALAEESLLDYPRAVRFLERVVELSPRPDRKDLKRLAACREAAQMWKQLKLNPDELEALGCFLRQKLTDSAPERSLRWTEAWLSHNDPATKKSTLESLNSLGYHSDFQVLVNLVKG
jgi:hypothetical protein